MCSGDNAAVMGARPDMISTSNDDDLTAVEHRLAAAVGSTAWGAALGVGSFLTVEFGPERAVQDPKQRCHGAFHLWVYCSAWRIETATAIIASSEDPRERLEATVRHLDGRTLSGIRIERPSLSASFTFDDGTVLRTFSIFSEEYEHWMFYLPGGSVFTAGPGSSTAWGP